jgi:septal ring-binding cell division protein DamX
VAKPNYSFEKRQRDLAKKKKKEEKLQKKAANKEAKVQEGASSEAPATPAEGGGEGGSD